MDRSLGSEAEPDYAARETGTGAVGEVYVDILKLIKNLLEMEFQTHAHVPDNGDSACQSPHPPLPRFQL
ncbi:hypothetical protein AAMO2058_001177100 [Amorphochlora amoebiformis]